MLNATSMEAVRARCRSWRLCNGHGCCCYKTTCFPDMKCHPGIKPVYKLRWGLFAAASFSQLVSRADHSSRV